MLTPQEVRVLDLNSAWHGVPTSILMRNAGEAVAAEVLRTKPGRVLVLAGAGNNGGDAAIAADALSKAGVATVVLCTRDPEGIHSSDARLAFSNLDRRSVRIETYRSPRRARELLSDADIVIDGLLGVGVTGELREPIRTIVKLANASHRPIVAVDVPSGLGTRLSIKAATTVTLHDRKSGMRKAECGTVRVRHIGIPTAASENGPGDLAVYYPRPAAESHKGDNGRLLAVLGGPYTGAPVLGALSAANTGCDLVHLATPRQAAEAAQAAAPDLIVHPGSDERHLVVADVEALQPSLARFGAVLVGSGLGKNPRTQAAVERLLELTQKVGVPLVLDADALRVAARHPRLLRGRPVLATPHVAEFRELTGVALGRGDARQHVKAQAKRLGITILLKARTAVVSDGARTKVGHVHPPGLTPGGVGDVLAGSCAALMSRGLQPFEAACAASFLVGAAARAAFNDQSWGTRATDVLDRIPKTLRAWLPSFPMGENDTVLT